MSRFHLTSEALDEDVAMQHYRRRSSQVDPDFDPADWIEALHREHWKTLAELRAFKAATPATHLAHVLADVHLALRRLKGIRLGLGRVREDIGAVLGETPVVTTLRAIADDLRIAINELDAVPSKEYD